MEIPLYSLYDDNSFGHLFDMQAQHINILNIKSVKGQMYDINGNPAAINLHVQFQLCRCRSITFLDLSRNLLVQSLSFVKCMPHLNFLDISGCNFIDSSEFIIYHVTQD
jgi:hypothetical protein